MNNCGCSAAKPAAIAMIILIVCGLCTSRIHAQETAAVDSVRQKEELTNYLSGVNKKLEDRQQAWLDAQKAKAQYDTVGLAQYRYEMKLLKTEKRERQIDFIKQHPAYPVSAEALKDVVGYLPEDIRRYSDLFGKLAPSVQNSKDGQALRTQIDRFLTVAIGTQAPLFTSADTLGKPVNLSDYKGKYVLLDFWASWCGPCREENPVVVKVWQKYKDKNFDILSVSLDQPGKREAWLSAIHKDNLTWQHVSSLKYWDDPVAKLYAVRSIPQNFLIDPQGKIIAANLRGEELFQELEKLLK